MEAITLVDMKEESFGLFKLGWIGKSTLVVVLVASLATTLFVKSNFARYVLFFAPKKRPLNMLIMIDQATVLVPHVVVASMTIVSIALGSSLVELADTAGICTVYWYSSIIYVAFTAFGSCGMAVYRLIIIKYESLARFVIGPKRLIVIILAIQNTVMVSVVGLYLEATLESKTGSALSFCTDRTFNYFKTIKTYQKGETTYEIVVLVQTLLLFVAIAVSLIELGSYVCIYIHIFRYNAQTPIGLVSPNVMKQRRLSNVMTLGGQSLAFALHNFCLLLAICVMNVPYIRGFLEEAAIMVIVIVLEAIKSVILLCSSPEMRRFMFAKND